MGSIRGSGLVVLLGSSALIAAAGCGGSLGGTGGDARGDGGASEDGATDEGGARLGSMEGGSGVSDGGGEAGSDSGTSERSDANAASDSAPRSDAAAGEGSEGGTSDGGTSDGGGMAGDANAPDATSDASHANDAGPPLDGAPFGDAGSSSDAAPESDTGADAQGAGDGSTTDGSSEVSPLCDDISGATDVTTVSGRGAVDLSHLVWDGQNYGLVWDDASTGTSEVYFAKLDASGNVVPGSVIDVSPQDGFLSAFPRAAFNGTEYGIVYSDDRATTPHRHVYFARVSAAGALIAGSEVSVGTDDDEDYPAIAWDPVDSVWGVAWQAFATAAGPGPTESVAFERIDLAGAVIAGGETTVSAANAAFSDSGNSPLLWNGTTFATTWSEYVDGSHDHVRLAEIAGATGIVTASSLTTIDGNASRPLRATLARGGSDYGVVWMNSSTTSVNEVYFARVSIGGGLIAGSMFSLTSGSGYAGEPSIAWNGAGYTVVWDGGGGLGTNISRAFVSTSGALVAGSEVEFVCLGSPSWWPEVDFNSGTNAMTYADGEEIHLAEFANP